MIKNKTKMPKKHFSLNYLDEIFFLTNTIKKRTEKQSKQFFSNQTLVKNW